MRKDEINAILGIDVDVATKEQLLKRGAEFCSEMAECYPSYYLEVETFVALHHVFCKLIGGEFHAD